MKRCSKCSIEKDDGDFLENRNACKECYRKQRKQWREANAAEIKEKRKQYHKDNAAEIKEKQKQYRKDNAAEIKEKQKQHNKDNAAKKMLCNARARSKQKGMPFDITEDDLINIWPTHCPVLGMELQSNISKGKAQPNSFSLDRIDSDRKIGYIPTNIRIISFRANTLKSNATLEELFQVGKDAEKLIEVKAKKNE